MATALRGNIHWHDFGPVTGAELSGNRPALIISNNFLNKSLTTAITVPNLKDQTPGKIPKTTHLAERKRILRIC